LPPPAGLTRDRLLTPSENPWRLGGVSKRNRSKALLTAAIATDSRSAPPSTQIRGIEGRSAARHPTAATSIAGSAT
jgi:hypothetical protein